MTNGGTVILINCTPARNRASEGGAIKTFAGTVRATNCTTAGNTGGDRGGGIYTNGYYRARTEVNNCLFVGNANNDPYLFDGPEHTGDCSLTSDGSAPGPHRLRNTRVALGPLGRHDGPPETFPLLTGCPALNAGGNDPVPSDARTDQRGLPRVRNGKVDIGAFEVQ